LDVIIIIIIIIIIIFFMSLAKPTSKSVSVLQNSPSFFLSFHVFSLFSDFSETYNTVCITYCQLAIPCRGYDVMHSAILILHHSCLQREVDSGFEGLPFGGPGLNLCRSSA